MCVPRKILTRSNIWPCGSDLHNVIHFWQRIPGMIVSSLLVGSFFLSCPGEPLEGWTIADLDLCLAPRIQSGRRLLDTDCRIKDGWGHSRLTENSFTVCSVCFLRQELYTHQCASAYCSSRPVFKISLIPMPQESLLVTFTVFVQLQVSQSHSKSLFAASMRPG